jgi:prepilin-type N-terminal cleavage/methylation domain-containing protein
MKIYSQKAFTLIELLVVVSIMMILALVVMTSVVEARKESRDTARATTAEQLSLGIRLFKEATGKYPVYPNGVELGVGNPIDAQLAPFIKEIPKDPLTQGSGDDYEYWYYPNFLCNGERHDVVIVKQMEMGDNGNFNEVCGGALLPMEIGLIPKAHAASYGGGGYGQSSYYSQSQYAYAQSSYGPLVCTATANPNTITLPQSGNSETVQVRWSSGGESTIYLTYPDGYSPRVVDYEYYYNLSLPSTAPAGRYTINVYESTRGGTYRGLCPLTLQVNPYVAPTQCNDGVDNADTEDTLVDMADPGCTSGTDTSEVNVVDYVDTPDTTPVTPTEVENYTSAAYVVFIN